MNFDIIPFSPLVLFGYNLKGASRGIAPIPFCSSVLCLAVNKGLRLGYLLEVVLCMLV